MTLLDDVARAIWTATYGGEPQEAIEMRPQARAALQTVARWLREPDNKTLDVVAKSWTAGPDGTRGELAEFMLRALASHLEKEMG